MKKIYSVFILLCSTVMMLNAQGSIMSDDWETIHYVIDKQGVLTISPIDPTATPYCAMPDFLPPGSAPSQESIVAPWYEKADTITSIVLSNVTSIGNNAFRDCKKLRYMTLPDEIDTIGENAFMGCVNLKVLEVRRFAASGGPRPITMLNANSLNIEDKTTHIAQVPLAIVPKRAYGLYSADQYWNNGQTVLSMDHEDETAISWNIGLSDSITQGLKLSIENIGSSDKLVIADRTDGQYFPWDALGDLVQDLVINDNISYIGAGVFGYLTGIQTIQFHQWKALDSMHVNAFASNIRPWKFALGDPQDGPAIPPKVLGYTADWNNPFQANTVLYVPDSLVDMGGGVKTKSIDLYSTNAFWGTVFNRITDRTVSSQELANKNIELKWLPLENATGYRLTVYNKKCNCDTTIVIPATGQQGLIDWASMSFSAGDWAPMRRAPQESGSGGLVIVIEIEPGSGTAHNEDVKAQLSGMGSEEEYSITREVLIDDAKSIVNPALTKTDSFVSPKKEETGLETVRDGQTGIRIYDLLGRSMGERLENLPEGIYIMDNSGNRTTILLRR